MAAGPALVHLEAKLSFQEKLDRITWTALVLAATAAVPGLPGRQALLRCGGVMAAAYLLQRQPEVVILVKDSHAGSGFGAALVHPLPQQQHAARPLAHLLPLLHCHLVLVPPCRRHLGVLSKWELLSSKSPNA